MIRRHLKSLQVLYYDSLVLRRPKPGKSTHHVTTLPWAHEASHASLSTEQTEINRIIAEASKGSKFYEVHLVAIRSVPTNLPLAFTFGRMKSGKTRK